MEQLNINEDNTELIEDKEEMDTNDIDEKLDERNLKLYEVTNDISLLPNNPNSVWLNGILISLLFSDRIRNIILNKIESTKNYDKLYEIFKFLINLLEDSPEKFKDEIDKLNDKVLLNLILDLSGIKRNSDNLIWCEYDIITILRKLNINITDLSIKDSTEIIDLFRLLAYDNRKKNWLIDINEYPKFGNIKNEKDLEPKITKRRDNKYSRDKDKNPDILILFYNDMNDMATNYSNLFNGIKEKDKNSGIIISSFFNPSTYNIKIYHEKLLSTGEIEFNGITYDLDVCLLNNNDFMSVKFKKDIDIGIIRDLIFEIDKMKKPELIAGINELTGVKNKYDNSTDLNFLKKLFFDESIKQLNINEEITDTSNNIVDIDNQEEEKDIEKEEEIKGGKGKLSKQYLISYIQKKKDMKGLSKMKKEELMRIYLRLKKRI